MKTFKMKNSPFYEVPSSGKDDDSSAVNKSSTALLAIPKAVIKSKTQAGTELVAKLTQAQENAQAIDVIPKDYKQKITPLPSDIKPEDYPETPSGFSKKETRHFVLYEEGEVSAELEKFSELIHGNIMLDLVAFSPWTREKKVFIFYSHSQESYRKLTGRPAWSGGAASLNERRIYLYASKDAFGILAHELTHMYFDSFFPPEHPSPLWLSEGVATFIQSERANSTPQWLITSLKKIQNGSGYKIQDLLRIDDLEGADEDNIRLWYAQSYSLARYLMHSKSNKVFYSFCNNVKNGLPVEQSLTISYNQGISALEYAWRNNLPQNSAAILNR